MKVTSTIALATILLTSCKKEGKDIQYTVNCSGCHVEYVNSDEVYANVSIDAHKEARTTVIDTTIAGHDTTITSIDTIMVPTEWNYSFEGEHNQTARVEVRHTSYAITPTVATVKVNGAAVSTAATSTAGATIVVKD